MNVDLEFLRGVRSARIEMSIVSYVTAIITTRLLPKHAKLRALKLSVNNPCKMEILSRGLYTVTSSDLVIVA